jgi:hypothetical protein
MLIGCYFTLKMNVAEKLASLRIPTLHRPPPNRFGQVNHSIRQTATYFFNSLLGQAGRNIGFAERTGVRGESMLRSDRCSIDAGGRRCRPSNPRWAQVMLRNASPVDRATIGNGRGDHGIWSRMTSHVGFG